MLSKCDAVIVGSALEGYMESSHIFLLFTSDRNEGAALNESMNSGCAVVASDAIGSVPYLMRYYEKRAHL